jgi:glycosyltransferase involved in cell wall biosynthesis
VERITTIGHGEKVADVQEHFEVPVLGLFQRYFGYLIRSDVSRFHYFFGRFLDRIPDTALHDADLVVINEIEYLHWGRFREEVLSTKATYLDLHEEHVGHADRGPMERFAFRKYWRWQLNELKAFVKHRKGRILLSSIEQVIADSYSRILDEPIQLIFNAPDTNSLTPSIVDPKSIKLVHHGMGTKGRGIEDTIMALNQLDNRFTLDLILFATPQFKIKIHFLIWLLRLGGRVRILPGVPLTDLPDILNRYDISVIVPPPLTMGNQNALPNKFFESMHAKLAIITGPNPSMKRIVQEEGIGFALETRTPKELARYLKGLSPIEIFQFKNNSVVASEKYSTDQSKKVFLGIISRLIGAV